MFACLVNLEWLTLPYRTLVTCLHTDTPILRHYSSAFGFYGAVPGAQLVVRMISTVYNYDYIQDLRMSVDGTVDVKVVTTGYVQATAFRPFYPAEYGFPLFTNVSGEGHLL